MRASGTPLSAPPRRLLSAGYGARYMGLSESEFRVRYDHLAKRQGERRLVWDIVDLDAEADKLPYARPIERAETSDSFADWQ